MEPKVIIVTGASRGIGFAVAQSLLAASHKVVLVSRSADRLQQLKERYPTQVAFLAADMTVADVSRRALIPSSPYYVAAVPRRQHRGPQIAY